MNATIASAKKITSPRLQSDARESWIDSNAACEYLAISYVTLRRWAKEGKVVARRGPGGAFRFRKSELDLVLA